jgi:hypothetical protein
VSNVVLVLLSLIPHKLNVNHVRLVHTPTILVSRYVAIVQLVKPKQGVVKAVVQFATKATIRTLLGELSVNHVPGVGTQTRVGSLPAFNAIKDLVNPLWVAPVVFLVRPDFLPMGWDEQLALHVMRVTSQAMRL